MTRDRHGRIGRADDDRRHRPTTGFRASDSTRFAAIVTEALEGLPDHLRAPLDRAGLVVEAVPPGHIAADGEPVALVRFEPGRRGGHAGEAGCLRVYRRPLELRALDRADLEALVRLAVARAVASALDLDLGDLDDDGS